MSKHLNDHFQLCAAALCLEENTGKTITYGAIFYHSDLAPYSKPTLKFISELIKDVH